MIIGLSGKAAAGKDTIAAMIAPIHPVWMDGRWQPIDDLIDGGGARRADPLRPRAAQIAFADPIKVVARELYDFSYQQLWGASAFRNDPDPRYPRTNGSSLSPREALQKLGTEMARELYANTWIDLGIRRVQQLMASVRPRRPDDQEHFASSWVIERVELVIISDVRFPNEIDAIKAAGGEVWRVVRPEAGLEGAAGAHVSETAQDAIPDSAFAKTIINSTSLLDLRIQVFLALRA